MAKQNANASVSDRLAELAKGMTTRETPASAKPVNYVGSSESGLNLAQALIDTGDFALNEDGIIKPGKVPGTDRPIVLVAVKSLKGVPTGNFTHYHTGKMVVAGSLPVDPAEYGFRAQ